MFSMRSSCSAAALCAAIGALTGTVALLHGQPPARPQGGAAAAAPSPGESSHRDSTQRGSARLFDADEVVQLTLTTDLRALLKDRDSLTATDHAATLSYAGPQNAPLSLSAKLKTRGHFRRSRHHCGFPPLSVSFDKGVTKHTLFGGQSKLKLTTPCRPKDDEYQQYVLEEYLAYRIYNLLTPRSFRVRLARVTYRDTAGKEDPITRYGFFMESERAMAERNGAKLLPVSVSPARAVDYEQMSVVGVYEYMIGNTDWSVPAQHNIRFIQSANGSVFPVPYDFDFSGLVGTSYATPDPKLSITTVRDRLYRGPCLTDDELLPIFAKFNNQRGAIDALYTSFPLLDRKFAKRSRDYLAEFFQTINGRKQWRREFVENRC